MSLLAIEWLKIRRYRTFWVMISLFLGMLILWNYGITQGFIMFGSSNFNLFSAAYSFPNVWDNIGFWTKIFSSISSVLVIILVTNEYQYKTNRQNIIDGWSRMQFYHAKWALIVALSLFITLFVFVLGIVFALVNGSSLSEIGGHISKLLYVLILNLNYFGMAMLLSVFLKRSGLTIGLFLLYAFMLELFLAMYLNAKFPDVRPGAFLPMQSSADSLPFQLMEMLKNIMRNNRGASAGTLACVGFGWVIVYYFVGRWKLQRSDW